MQRARLEFPGPWRWTIEQARQHRAAILLIEEQATGQPHIQILRAETQYGVPSPIVRRPEGDKLSRTMSVSAIIEA